MTYWRASRMSVALNNWTKAPPRCWPNNTFDFALESGNLTYYYDVLIKTHRPTGLLVRPALDVCRLLRRNPCSQRPPT